ncbi:MAG TPA: VanZ family protein [Candidatus Portnoybacteria bacterium]|jgi:VanZ family protein|nr:VanZ family protein [Candidatus Portnoybacteria bacterium]MDD5752003.1 VanZ family protein [Candidatus Portnoybacteria bacterium]HNU96779.1 VanZ family protein [Candidatus Portnoybacteria bacterium]HOZ16193.1 VanZ family protein [Candidatus Portnoybacteria bacterium]HPH52012.1 VanZ family protein [Candidatus Portnoybacteria bacterium]
MKKFLKYWLPAVVWAGVIFMLSAIPNLKTDSEQDFLLRKIAHMVEFGILTWLFFRALNQEKISFRKTLIFSFIFALFYACSDEFHQLFVRNRHGSLADVGIDAMGIFIFCLMCYIKNRKVIIRHWNN